MDKLPPPPKVRIGRLYIRKSTLRKLKATSPVYYEAIRGLLHSTVRVIPWYDWWSQDHFSTPGR